MSTVLYDELGPRGRRRVRIASVLGYAGIALLRRLDEKGQLEGRRWKNLTNPDLLESLGTGLWNNVKAALVAMALALVFGAVMALMRLSRSPVPRWIAGTIVEFFRALPQLLL